MDGAPRHWMRWDEDEQRGFALAAAISLAGHVVLFVLLTFAPGPKPLHAPASISVRLVAALPVPARGGAAKATESVPKPAPAPAPAPPKPVAKKRVLPKDPAPARPKPARRPRPEEMKYEDALATLRAEMGDATPEPRAPDAPDERAGPTVDELLATAGEPQAGSGAQVSPELARWLIDTKRHVRSVWITPPDFLNRALSTELRVRLGPTGEVMGTPAVVRSSGDPYWDDNAIRALMKASPLPAPPEPGVWPFLFSP